MESIEGTVQLPSALGQFLELIFSVTDSFSSSLSLLVRSCLPPNSKANNVKKFMHWGKSLYRLDNQQSGSCYLPISSPSPLEIMCEYCIQAMVEVITRWSWSVLVATDSHASTSCAVFAALFRYIAIVSLPTGKCRGGRSVLAS